MTRKVDVWNANVDTLVAHVEVEGVAPPLVRFSLGEEPVRYAIYMGDELEEHYCEAVPVSVVAEGVS